MEKAERRKEMEVRRGKKIKESPWGKQCLGEPSPGKVLEATESFPESQKIVLMLQKICRC